jgi:hypothetical protein
MISTSASDCRAASSKACLTGPRLCERGPGSQCFLQCIDALTHPLPLLRPNPVIEVQLNGQCRICGLNGMNDAQSGNGSRYRVRCSWSNSHFQTIDCKDPPGICLGRSRKQ